MRRLLGLGSARVNGQSDGLPGASLWPGAEPLLRDKSLGPPDRQGSLKTHKLGPGNDKIYPRWGDFGGWSQAVARRQRQRYDNHASDHAAAIPPGEAEIAQLPNQMEELASVTTTSVILRSSPQIGVGYGD